jgi:hypothetical protein
MNRNVSLCLVAFALGACDAQVEGTYEGEPLATIRGDIITSALGAPQRTDKGRLAVVWTPRIEAEATGDEIVYADATEVAVEGSFPTSFELEILEPPPDSALTDAEIGGKTVKYASGIFLVLDAAIPSVGKKSMPWNEMWESVRGAEPRHNLIYIAEDVPADPYYGNVPMAKGYHLIYGKNRLPAGNSHVATAEEKAQCFLNHVTSYGLIVPDMTRYCDQSYGGAALAEDGLDTKLSVTMIAPEGEHPFTAYVPSVGR